MCQNPTLYGQAMSKPCATPRSIASRRSATAARRSPRRVWQKPRHTNMNAVEDVAAPARLRDRVVEDRTCFVQQPRPRYATTA